MIVIDASALAKFVLKEEGSSSVVDYLRSGTLSPQLVLKEVANAIWRSHAHARTSREEADKMVEALMKLVETAVRLEDQEPHIKEAIRISLDRKVTVYDSIYVAVAKGKALNLITADVKQSRVAEAEGVNAVLIR